MAVPDARCHKLVMAKESLPADLRAFIRAKIRSVWGLEALLLLRGSGRAWRIDELTRELRSSQAAVTDVVLHFAQSGLLIEEAGSYLYRPARADDDRLVAQLGDLYAQSPMALIYEIANAPKSNIQGFADAFRLKKD